MRDLDVLELTIRLLAAAGAAIVLGLEREIRGHPAGIRTHALVAIGAALFTITGAYGFADLPRGPNVDPARLAAQVASGVGFLGAGAILRSGLGVKGLTTAATVWLAAALGVAAGAGAYAAVGVGTVVMVFVLVGLRLSKPLVSRLVVPVTVLDISYQRGFGTLGPVLRTLDGLTTKLDHLEVTDEDEEDGEGLRHVSLHIATRDIEQVYVAVDALRHRPEVRTVRFSGAGPRGG